MIVINNASMTSASVVTDDTFPIGGIVLWYGIASAVPSGYIICDGTLGTPAIQNKFVRGATLSTELLTTGGTTTHVHSGVGTDSISDHNHSTGTLNWGAATYNTSYYNTPTVTVATESHGHSSSGATVSSSGGHDHSLTGVTNAASSIPPYKKLYWIKRIA